MTRLELERLIKDIKEAAGEATRRRAVTGTVGRTKKEAFTLGYDKQQERLKTAMRNMVEGAEIDIFERGGLDTILVRNVDRLSKSTGFYRIRDAISCMQ